MLKLKREDIGRLVMTGERHVVRLVESDEVDRPYAYYHPVDHIMVNVMENGHHVEKYRTGYDVGGFVAEGDDESRPEDGFQKSLVRLKTLRDEFAMSALTGMVGFNYSVDLLAKRSYEVADMMMKVREEK
jgi:hypothetical protein